MTFIEGFLTPVPTANKERYLKHAREAVPLFRSLGATRFVETWGDDIPDGKLNDLKQAVQATPEETVLFSWIEYPDRATRDAANKRMGEDASMMNMDMPFDAKRMIFAGFQPILDEGTGAAPGYVDGILLAVPEDRKDDYLALARKTSGMFQEFGAVRVVETWGEDVPDGKVTDYNRAVLRKDGERVVYSWIEWPDKATRDAGWQKLMSDERMQPGDDTPFDGQRMIWGGFSPIIDERN
ncbi:MAG: DUF1428 domain-containing protein [Sphingomonadales bacterium]|jgi:uncharacterized protein YbaA (DUF1428 family)|nr:MAG: DUF1428 domain-containing protein [Sphingomonadales bacterium]